MIHVIIGTRAQYIKMAPVLLRLTEEGLDYNLIHTGQHRLTINDILDGFALRRPDALLYDGPDIVTMTGMFAWAVRVVFAGWRRRRQLFGGGDNGLVLIHGDTFSTIVGALLGRAAGLKVGHVESGLRSFDLWDPFPEEITRRLAFRLSHTLFCPGEWAAGNVASLKRTVVDTGGNTMADAVARAGSGKLRSDHLPEGPFALVSLHRYENIFKPRRLEFIVAQLEKIARKRRLLFILHPPTEARLRRQRLFGRLDANEDVELRPRYSYHDFFALMKAADFVVTDGGSIQEESCYLGLPCLLMRGTSERTEGLGENVVLSLYDPETIGTFTDDPGRYRREPADGGTDPSGVIVSHLKEYA